MLYRGENVGNLSPADLVKKGGVQVMEGRHCFEHLTVEENGRALMARPETILLDEPSMGLAPQLVEEIFAIVRDLNEKEGVSFLLAEQNTKAALRFAHHG